MSARSAVAAEANHLVLEFHAALFEHLEGTRGVFRHRERELRMIETATRGHHVRDELFGGVFDALRFLHFRERHAHQSAAEGRVAAPGFHLLKNENAANTLLHGFVGGGKACKTRADDDDVVGFVPMLRFDVSGQGFSGRTRGEKRTECPAQNATAADVGVFHKMSPSRSV